MVFLLPLAKYTEEFVFVFVNAAAAGFDDFVGVVKVEDFDVTDFGGEQEIGGIDFEADFADLVFDDVEGVAHDIDHVGSGVGFEPVHELIEMSGFLFFKFGFNLLCPIAEGALGFCLAFFFV